MNIPIRNDYDFLSINDVTVNWQVFVDDRMVGSGTGLPVAVTKDGRKTIDGLRPTIWHRLDEGDQIIKNRNFEKGVDPEVFTANVQSMDVAEQGKAVVIRSSVGYRIDKDNTFTADYVSTIDELGRLTVDYTIRPQVQMTYLPVVGMAVKRRAYSSASEHWKVVPFEMSPVCKPSLNHFMRCFDVPWLNDSGTA